MRIRFTLLAAVAAAPVLFAQTARHPVPGHMRPGIVAANDRGRLSASRSLRHVTLTLERSSAQEAELRALLARQQDPSSPDFHKWLTPEQFADRFGLPQSDIDRIASWLRTQNLTLDSVDRGRTAISFSGNVRNVERALQVEIHNYEINGEAHFSNTAEPSVPAEIGSFVASVRGLDDFRMKPRSVRSPAAPQPNYTSVTTGAHYLGPDDIAKIYDVQPLYDSGITGKGQKIAVVGQTQIDVSDIQQFRTYFNLPQNDPTMLLVPKSTDPGISNDDLPEADLDVEWSGAIARDAEIVYVYSDDVRDALDYVIDNQIAPVVSMSYGLCEQLTAFPPLYQGLEDLSKLAEKADSFGISWIAASGDNGANDCYGLSHAPDGLSVDAPASVPLVTGVGGTTLTEGSGTYWSSANSGNHASALSYIPEGVWNDDATDGSGGGASIHFAKPSWQTGAGVPNDGMRDVPDVSMAASPNHDGYLVYTGGILSVYGGTSVGAPVVAGTAGLLNQYVLANGYQQTPGQGSLNSRLYSLAASAPAAFHDVTVGNNITAACPQSACAKVGFTAGPGYDQTTGLGTLDVFNLITAWPPTPPTATREDVSVTISPTLTSLSSDDTTTLKVTVTATDGGTPSGTVSLLASGKPVAQADLTASGATFTVPAADLDPGENGEVVIAAVYNGDAVYTWKPGFTTVQVSNASAMVLNSITSAASFQNQYAPGMIISLFGTNFASATPDAPPAPLPTQLAGTSVTINGILSPIYYVSPTQINVQVPWEIPRDTTAIIKVTSNGKSVTDRFEVDKNAPEIFGDTNNLMVPYQTTRPGDSAFLFVTGDGLFSAPAVVTGAIPPAGTLTALPTSARVTVGGVPASVFFVGEPSWSVGVSQINFTIPENAPLGTQPVIVTIGGVKSSPVYITVSR